MADVKPDPIFQVASGFLAAKHLFVAVEIGLFEKLAQGVAKWRVPEEMIGRRLSQGEAKRLLVRLE